MKNQFLIHSLLAPALCMALGIMGFAQEPPPGKRGPWGQPRGDRSPGQPRGDRSPGPPPGSRPGSRPGSGPGSVEDADRRGPDFRFQSFEFFSDHKVVKGQPYSATAVTETVQTLQDGSKLTRKKTDTLYRDSEGRTRREQQFDRVGPFPVEGEPRQVVFLHDAVTGQRAVLDPSRRTARRMPGGERPARPPFRPPPSFGSGGAPGGMGPDGERKTESLGRRTIEGVEVDGVRTTFTIPAGKIGNDRELKSISERWESPDLQVVVLSKHSDPFAGETTYRLINIKRDEPPRSLFEVPADYTIEEGRPGPPPREGHSRRPER